MNRTMIGRAGVAAICALLFGFAMSGCGGKDDEGTIRGTVTFLQRIALPNEAVLNVSLVDATKVAASPRVIAWTEKINPGQVPIPFELNYEKVLLEEGRSYGVSARIQVDGMITFIAGEPVPVFGAAGADSIEIVLQPVRRPPQPPKPADEDEEGAEGRADAE